MGELLISRHHYQGFPQYGWGWKSTKAHGKNSTIAGPALPDTRHPSPHPSLPSPEKRDGTQETWCSAACLPVPTKTLWIIYDLRSCLPASPSIPHCGSVEGRGRDAAVGKVGPKGCCSGEGCWLLGDEKNAGQSDEELGCWTPPPPAPPTSVFLQHF